MAPELEDGRAEEISPRSDVYSLGKLLYWLRADEIFAREKHRQGKWDLTANELEPAIHLLYQIFDKTIVTDPAGRFESAVELFEEFESVCRRIDMQAHAIGKGIPQLCSYCGVGEYKVYSDTTMPDDLFERVTHDLGLIRKQKSIWQVLICDHCGNVQTFRLDQTKDPNLWTK